MSLIGKIRDDLTATRKARDDSQKAMLLSTLLGEAARVGKDAGNRETTDAETMAVVRKFLKNADQAVADLNKAGRDAGHIQREIEILGGYLPASVPVAEIEAAVREIAAGLGGGNPKAALGTVIKGLKDRFGDRFDGGTMSPVAKRVLEE